jgi:DNA invertase Pin-like site-specific DNA recombinase
VDRVPEGISIPKKNGGSNLSLAQIDKIRQMHEEGRTAAEIAVAVKTTVQTVYRRIKG